MSNQEAQDYADAVVEALVEMRVITQERYGNITEEQRHKLADIIKEKSEE